MGWNNSRVSLLAPGWRMVTEEDCSNAGTLRGTPLRILHPERVSVITSSVIRPEALQGWLEEYGFEVRQRSQFGNRLQSEDVEVNLGTKDGAVAEVVLTFTLARDSPFRLDAWESLVKRLCEVWGLSIYVSDLGFTVGADEFRRVLGSTSAWQDFSTNFQWPSI